MFQTFSFPPFDDDGGEIERRTFISAFPQLQLCCTAQQSAFTCRRTLLVMYKQLLRVSLFSWDSTGVHLHIFMRNGSRLYVHCTISPSTIQYMIVWSCFKAILPSLYWNTLIFGSCSSMCSLWWDNLCFIPIVVQYSIGFLFWATFHVLTNASTNVTRDGNNTTKILKSKISFWIWSHLWH